MPVRSFGPSTVWAGRTDIANSTPVKFGAMQNLTLSYKGTLKKLMGQGQFAEAFGRSEVAVSGKISYGHFQGGVFGSLFFGNAMAAGMLNTVQAEAAVIPAEAPYTVIAAQAASFFSDNGVSYAATAVPLQQVASAPAVGQYAVNVATGTYTFAAADEGKAIVYDYVTKSATAGQSMTISQVAQGIQPVFQIVNERVFNGPNGLEKIVMTLNACYADDLETPTKQGDWGMQDMGFQAGVDITGTLGTINLNQVT